MALMSSMLSPAGHGQDSGPGPASQRTRVLHIITRLEPGGAQRNTLYTVSHLDRDRFEAGLAWGPGDELDECAEAIADLWRQPIGELVRPVAPKYDLGALRRLRAAVRSFGAQIVHTHSSKAGIVGRMAARLERVPVVIHSIHGFGFTPLQSLPVRALFFAAEKIASRWTDHFVAVSERDLERGVALGLFERHRVRLIRSGVELERFRKGGDGGAVRRRLGIPHQSPVVTQIGNFKPQKAPLDFVRMAAEVAARVPSARFVMVGEGSLRSRAEALARRLGVGEKIIFCGWWDDVPALLAASRVSVMSSRHEGLPRAVVESLAAGVPVVATAVDGTPEVVRDGVNGFLVEAGDVDGLADRVMALLTDDELHDRTALAAPHGLEEFDIDLMVRQQEDLYRWLLSRNPS
jgi:glycosyltransferase involved in cell wall biosynthesis